MRLPLLLSTLALMACGSSPAEPPAETPDPDPIPSRGSVVTVQLAESHSFDGLYMDPNGVLFGAGGWLSDEVIRINEDGTWESFSTGHGGPIHMTLGGDGNYYVTNYSDNTIRRVSPDGSENTILAEDLDGPSGAVTTPDGTVYFVGWGAEGRLGRIIYRVTEEGEVVEHVNGQGLSVPQGLASDENGNLFVANAVDGRIHRVTPEGVVTLIAQLPVSGGYNIAHMVYGNDRLYATGGGNNFLYEVRLDGTFISWGGGLAGSPDGPIEDASFNEPGGLAISPDGKTLWIAESSSNSLRKVTFN